MTANAVHNYRSGEAFASIRLKLLDHSFGFRRKHFTVLTFSTGGFTAPEHLSDFPAFRIRIEFMPRARTGACGLQNAMVEHRRTGV
ncbi:MAG: hypothetical protein WDN01_07850 [Rhizomicrobium sp.]